MADSLGASSLKRIISNAAKLIENDTRDSDDSLQKESEGIVQSIIHTLGSQLARPSTNDNDDDDDEDLDELQQQDIRGDTYLDLAGWNKLMSALEHFPSGSSNVAFPDNLLSAIKTQLKERHLQCLPGFLEKVYIIN